MGRVREFGQLETAIMDVIWAADRPYVVREVRERLRYGRPVAYSTVMTVMTILHGKGFLHREKQGRAWRYWPAEAREEHDARLMSEVLRSGGDRLVTLRRFLDRVTDEELRSLRRAADDASARREPAVALAVREPAAGGPPAIRGGLAERAEYVVPPVLQARQIRPDLLGQL